MTACSRTGRVRTLLRAVCWLLPPHRTKNRVLRMLGHQVDPTARLGVCLVDGATDVTVGAGAVIGHGNVFRRLRILRVGAGAIIGQLNWVSSAPWLWAGADAETAGAAVLDDHAVITNRHYLDCSGGFRLAEFCTLAGVRSTVLTHSIDLATGKQTLAPVFAEQHVFIGTNCTIMPGSRLAERAVLAAGGVTAMHGRYERHTLYGGVPAKPIRQIDGAYFQRTQAWVSQ